MSSSSSSGLLVARRISHGGIAGATVGVVVGATIVFLLFLPFILRAIRETRYRRRISSDNAEMGYAGAAPVPFGAAREPYNAPYYPQNGPLPPIAAQPGFYPPSQPGSFGLQAPPTTYHPGSAPAGPAGTFGHSTFPEAGNAQKAQDGLASAPSSEPVAAGPADAQPDAAATAAPAAATDATLTTAAASEATTSTVTAPTADATRSASPDQTAASATPAEASAAPADPAAPETAAAAHETSERSAAPAVSSSASDGPAASPSTSGRPPAVAPINTSLAQNAAESWSADQLRTPPPLARGTAATFPASYAQPSPPFQPRQRSATMRSSRSRRSASLLDRATSFFRTNSNRVELTRGPPDGRPMPDLSRSPIAMGFQEVDGPDHHSWLMSEQGVRIEPEIPGHSVFEVDLNNLTGLSAEYYSEGPLSPPIDSSYLMYPTSYAPKPPSALASSLAGMATAGAIVGVAASPDRANSQRESVPRQIDSLQLPTAGKKSTDKAVSPLPPSPTSPSPFARSKFPVANGDRVGWMEDVQEEPHEEGQVDSASRKHSASSASASVSASAAPASTRGELTPDPQEFMRSPSHLTLVPSPRLPAPGTVNPRDVWAPATDDERFVHKTAELDRIEQTPPAGQMEGPAGYGTASAATSSPSAHDSDGGVGSVSGTSGTSGMSHMSHMKPEEEIDPVVVPDELRQSTESSEPCDSGAQFMPALQRNSMPTPEQIGSSSVSPAPEMKTMPEPAAQQPTFQVTTPDSFQSPENYETPEVYESPEGRENQRRAQSQQSPVYKIEPEPAQLTQYSSPEGLATVGADASGFATGPASASVQSAHTPAQAPPMPVSTHDAPAPAMAHVSGPMNGVHDQAYAPGFTNDNNLFSNMAPQTFAGDFNFNYNMNDQGGYMVDNMFPSLPTGKMSDFAMVQQPNDAQFYWPVPGGLAMMPEQPYTSPNGLYYPSQAFGHADAMVYHQHGGGPGAPQHFPAQTPQSSPGYASAGFSDDSAVQMQSLPSATSSAGAASVGKPVSPPMVKPAVQPFLSLSVPGLDGATQPLSPLSSQGSTPGQTNTPLPRGFTCDECGRSFDQIHKLNHHKRYHERPHECTVAGCGKRFGTKTHLDRHFNDKHSKSRKYHCTEEGCPYSVVGGKSFPRKDNWRRHMVNKHGVQPEHEPIEVVDVPMMGMPV